MSEMVERVARTLRQRLPGDVFLTEDNLENMARAAIAAMREPTEHMIEIGLDEADACTDGGTVKASCIPEHLWPAMIDAALT